MSEAYDVVLVFPPQWSPCQPALAIPSLIAWLRRENVLCTAYDLNLAFFDWLISDRAIPFHLEATQTASFSPEKAGAYRAIFHNARLVRDDLRTLQTATRLLASESDQRAFVGANYQAIRSLDVFLSAISDVYPFYISLYEFYIKAGALSRKAIEAFIASPPSIVRAFVEDQVSRLLAEAPAPFYGLSCIGQEQLVFTLALGRELKKKSNSQVVIGGTIFSRMHERGRLPTQWFGRYFDFVIRNEGEVPLVELLKASQPDHLHSVPNLIFSFYGEITSTKLAPSLRADDMPIPNFDDYNLDAYYTSEITLPILSSRGCYWGKCEFCHSFMAYGDRYGAYKLSSIKAVVRQLHQRYGVTCFSFNDEAIPPKILRELGKRLPQIPRQVGPLVVS